MALPEIPVGTTDELAQFELKSLTVNPTYFLEQAASFFAAQLKPPDPQTRTDTGDSGWEKLTKTELVKAKDLWEDVMTFATDEELRRLGRLTWLGWLFAWFERVMSSPTWPPSAWTIAWPRLRPEPVSPNDALPEQANSPFSQCAAEFCLFDGLSRIYGGRFRGSVVVNCVLGVFASTAVLYSLVHVHPTGETGVPPATAFELLCLVFIGLIFYRGSTPDIGDEEEPVSAATLKFHFDGQRWHQRWLEYRILAERLRYANLLLPLREGIPLRFAIAPKHSAGQMWHQRYFEWCVGRAAQSTRMVPQYRKHVLDVIAMQKAYHEDNHRRRGTIAHRLHSLARAAFIVALLICAGEIALSLHGGEQLASGKSPTTSQVLAAWFPFAGGWLQPLVPAFPFVGGWFQFLADPSPSLAPWFSYLAPLFSYLATCLRNSVDWFPFLGAWLPVIAAAAYAILTHAEYAKAADASAETYDYIDLLHKRLESMPPVSDEEVDSNESQEMSSVVIEFVGTAIAEATGWRAMLRDKNVPLV
jgi:hypothetical protein